MLVHPCEQSNMPDDAKDLPKGQRFTDISSERGKPTQDSTKMRRRLASLIDSIDAFQTGEPKKSSQRALELPRLGRSVERDGIIAKWDPNCSS